MSTQVTYMYMYISMTNTAGPPDTEYLYYPLYMEGVTLKGSLLPALR